MRIASRRCFLPCLSIPAIWFVVCSEEKLSCVSPSSVDAFTPPSISRQVGFGVVSRTRSSTVCHAIGVLARKAKEAEVRKYVEEGGMDADAVDVKGKLDELKSNIDSVDLSPGPAGGEDVGPLQQSLTKRKGTISVVSEYKRKKEGTGYIDEVFDPEVLSPTFREFGASAIAVLADERMGGCTYADLTEFITEQESARGDVPGPLPVICSELIVDQVQIARSAAYDASAVVLTPAVIGMEKLTQFLRASKALGMEAIVNVSTQEEAQQAVNAGATLLCVVGIRQIDEKAAVITDLQIPDGVKVCTIASVPARDDKELQEIEEAWTLRDKGFNAVWVSDALYKFGADANEHPGAIIKSMIAKSSVKWASPTARSGKGEGAKEYLGDILM